MSFRLPSAVGPYPILGTVYHSGMTWVLASEVKTPSDTQPRRVAVKTLMGMSVVDDVTRERFRREVQLAIAVRHPNVCAVLDFGYWGDATPYLVMEYLEGETLLSWHRKFGPRSLDEACTLMDQALAGVEALHAANIVHRNLTPDNLFRTVDGTLKILDLGLARQEGMHASLTESGLSLGAEDFMSPDQMFNARHLDLRSDLFTLGKVLYWLLTGQLPYGGNSLGEKLSRMLEGPPEPIPDVPEALNQWLARMLRVTRSERFATASEARTALAAAVTA
ncbi:MAG: serine/threonine-protein kinase [Candidatus Xenobia bacterium]